MPAVRWEPHQENLHHIIACYHTRRTAVRMGDWPPARVYCHHPIRNSLAIFSRDSTKTRPLPRLASKSNYNGRCNRSIKLKGLRMRLPMLNPRYRHSPNHHQTDENPRLLNQQHRQLGQSLHVIWSAIERYHTYQGENTLFVKTTGAGKSFMIVLIKLMEGKVTFVVLEQVKEQVWITLQYVTADSKFWGNHPDSAYWIKTNLWLEYGAKPKTINQLMQNCRAFLTKM